MEMVSMSCLSRIRLAFPMAPRTARARFNPVALAGLPGPLLHSGPTMMGWQHPGPDETQARVLPAFFSYSRQVKQ